MRLMPPDAMARAAQERALQVAGRASGPTPFPASPRGRAAARWRKRARRPLPHIKLRVSVRESSAKRASGARRPAAPAPSRPAGARRRPQRRKRRRGAQRGRERRRQQQRPEREPQRRRRGGRQRGLSWHIVLFSAAKRTGGTLTKRRADTRHQFSGCTFWATWLVAGTPSRTSRLRYDAWRLAAAPAARIMRCWTCVHV